MLLTVAMERNMENYVLSFLRNDSCYFQSHLVSQSHLSMPNFKVLWKYNTTTKPEGHGLKIWKVKVLTITFSFQDTAH